MIIGKNSAVKGFSLLGLAILAVCVCVTGFVMNESFSIVLGCVNLVAQAILINYLWNKWRTKY